MSDLNFDNKNLRSQAQQSFYNQYIGWAVAGGVFFIVSVLGIFKVGPAKSLSPIGLIVAALCFLILCAYGIWAIKKARQN